MSADDPHGDPGPVASSGATEPDPDAPASVEERVEAALDAIDDVFLKALPMIVERLEAVERASGAAAAGGAGQPERRSDFRFADYPVPDGDDEVAANLARASAAWGRLHTWVLWLTRTFRLSSVIPACWAEHAALLEEMVALYLAWDGAWLDGASTDAPAAFLDRVERVRGRLTDSNWGTPRCNGEHDGTGLDLAEHYRAWRDNPQQEKAVTAARDRALADLSGTASPRSRGEG